MKNIIIIVKNLYLNIFVIFLIEKKRQENIVNKNLINKSGKASRIPYVFRISIRIISQNHLSELNSYIDSRSIIVTGYLKSTKYVLAILQ